MESGLKGVTDLTAETQSVEEPTNKRPVLRYKGEKKQRRIQSKCFIA